MILVGASGSGKTGACASLAKDYRLIFADFDNGLDMLKAALTKQAPERMSSIYYKSFSDLAEWQGSGLVVKNPRAFQDAQKSVSKWIEDDGSDLGGIRSWGPDTILIIDSLTRLSRSAMNLILSLNNRLATGPTQSDWYDAQGEIETFLGMLTAPDVKCNVIIMAHLDSVDDPIMPGMKRSAPMALGQKLGPRVPTYFNTMLLAKTKGVGDNAKRIIRTTPDGSLEVKYPALPGTLPSELPIESGLGTFFRTMKSLAPKDTPKAAQHEFPLGVCRS